jgi:hypothetical protein
MFGIVFFKLQAKSDTFCTQLGRGMVLHLKALKTQSNYLRHNIHALLRDRVEEIILERHDLVENI